MIVYDKLGTKIKVKPHEHHHILTHEEIAAHSFELAQKRRKHKILSLILGISIGGLTAISGGIGIAYSQGLNNETILPDDFLSFDINQTSQAKELVGFNQNKLKNGQNFREFLVQHAKIHTIKIPFDCLEIKEYTFDGDSIAVQNNWMPESIDTISFPNYEETDPNASYNIKNKAFHKAFSVTNINVETVSIFGDSCFANCSIKKVKFGSRLQSLGALSFSHNENLEVIDFSSCPRQISTYGLPFSGCPNIKKIICGKGEATHFKGILMDLGIENSAVAIEEAV